MEEKFELWENLKKNEAYKLSLELGEIVWQMVDLWPAFARQTIGYQYTRSAESVGANIAEGWGKFSYDVL